jgi:hypothetical protein
MIDQKKRTYQSQTLSLLTLKLILTEAKKESPPQMRKEERGDEELALKLITSMKKEYRKVNVVASRSFLAAKQSPSPLGIASGYCPRNDIEIEP